jgi:serine O-acetyltransferase
MTASGSQDAESYPSTGKCSLTERGPWWPEFLEDLGRYRAHHGGSTIKPLLLEQGLWALLQYRWASGIHRRGSTGPAGVVLGLVAVLTQKITEIVTGISLPAEAQLFAGQYIGHFGPTVVNKDAVIGAGCNISQGVSIGISGRGARRGCPVIGPRVYIGANAVVAGPITVGADVVIAANSLVNRDVPEATTVVGVPAIVVSSNGTAGMGLHQRPRR